MIISCPACETQFNVDALKLAPAGRKVRCAKCAHVWKAGPEGQPVEDEATAPAESTMQGEPATPEPAPPVGGHMESGTDEIPAEEVASPADGTGDSEAGAEEEGPHEEDGATGEEGAVAETNGGKAVLLTEDGKGGTKVVDAAEAEKAALANLAATQKALKGKRKSGGGLTRTLLLLLLLLLVILGALAFANSRGLINLSSLSGGETGTPAEIGVVTSESPKPVEGGHILETAE